jgi:nitric oxide dioxygenase
MIGMLGHPAATGSARKVIAVHADRTQRSHAFRTDLEQLVHKLPEATAHVWYEEPEGPWPAERTGLADLSGVPLPADTRLSRAKAWAGRRRRLCLGGIEEVQFGRPG